MKNLEFFVTLWPTFPHFGKFVHDSRLAGIRLNSAMVKGNVLNNELDVAKKYNPRVPLWFDIKGRQMRVHEAIYHPDNLELVLNHAISVKTPTDVLFKAGEDIARLREVKDGTHLIFEPGLPYYKVEDGESLHIRDSSLIVKGPIFTEQEVDKMKRARAAGLNHFFLSYVESQKDIDEFREHVGDSEIIAKIESKAGLEFVARDYKKQEGVSLMAARGDLYIEVNRPHEILDALKLIIKKDSEASVGSRLLLTALDKGVPECADFSDLAWLYDLGYRRMMLCDGLCLKEEPLTRAVNVLDAFRSGYALPNTAPTYSPAPASPRVGSRFTRWMNSAALKALGKQD